MFRYYLLGGDTLARSGLYARICHTFLVYFFFRPLGYIADFACVNFFLFYFFVFFNYFSRQIISRSAGPIFAIFSPNESVLDADDRSGPLIF